MSQTEGQESSSSEGACSNVRTAEIFIAEDMPALAPSSRDTEPMSKVDDKEVLGDVSCGRFA